MVVMAMMMSMSGMGMMMSLARMGVLMRVLVPVVGIVSVRVQNVYRDIKKVSLPSVGRA